MTIVGEVIRAVAEGTTGSLEELRRAGIPVDVDAFEVEVLYAGDAGEAADPGEVSANLRVRFTTQRAVPDQPE